MYDQEGKASPPYRFQSSSAASSEVIKQSGFYTQATALDPVTDKISAPSQQYHYIYGKYADLLPKKRGPVLEIGLGCNMGYGPGASASVWTAMGFQ